MRGQKKHHIYNDMQQKVLMHMQNPDQAALLLKKINLTNIALIEFILQKYNNDKTQLAYILASRLKNKYLPDRLQENDPTGPDDTSYTENKGEVLAICLREKVNGNQNFEEYNILIFVSVHELAHIASIGYGHENEFWKNFKILLTEASLSGLYEPVNYEINPINYCGLDVTYNPMFDSSLN